MTIKIYFAISQRKTKTTKSLISKEIWNYHRNMRNIPQLSNLVCDSELSSYFLLVHINVHFIICNCA